MSDHPTRDSSPADPLHRPDVADDAASPGAPERVTQFPGFSPGVDPDVSRRLGPEYISGGATTAAEVDLHLTDYLKVLHRRRWTALTVFVVIVLAVSVYTFTSTPIYSAKVQILIEKENANIVTFKEAFEQNQVTDDYYQTQYKILQSRALARRTINALKLWNHPQFNPPAQQVSITSIARAPIGFLRGLLSRPTPEPPSATETKTESRAIDRLLHDLTIAPVRNSRLVDVAFASPDPAFAANVANALGKQYIEQERELKFLASKEASDWLVQRLGEQRKQVETSEQALQHYREQSDAVSLEERQNIVVQKLGDLNGAVTRAKIDRVQKEAAYNQIQAIQTNHTTLDTIPAILSNHFIQQQKAEIADLQRQQSQLSEKLGPNHPDMRKVATAIQNAETKLQGEIAKVVQSMRNDYQAALMQERTLSSALEQQKREALDLNRKGIDYSALQRDATTNRQIFESLLQRTKETGISGELKASNIRVVDSAEVPRAPVSPNTTANLLLAIFGGAMFGVGLAFFFEYLDNRIKTPEEITRHLGLPFLGIIPALFDDSVPIPLITSDVPMAFGESFRALRTNLIFSLPFDGPHSVVVTSTRPEEGKTVVASNLAIALAQAGKRVLLVDADMRRPRVHHMLGQSQAPGLSNVLAGRSKASEAVRASRVPGLWVLPAGQVPTNPAELLSARRYQEFQLRWEQSFDWIVLDAPPVMAVTDAAVIANLATCVLFVVGAEMTRRRAAQTARAQLERAHAPIIGAVLNKVDLKHHAYYYSEYYSPEYSEHYEKADAV
jgi:succinoglycan biosynthesis transport protein ExoP